MDVQPNLGSLLLSEELILGPLTLSLSLFRDGKKAAFVSSTLLLTAIMIKKQQLVGISKPTLPSGQYI